jgi:homoserine kinase
MIDIRVPATSANVGPGFDCLGLALSLHNRFLVEEAPGLELEGCAPAHACPDNLFVQACQEGFQSLGRPMPGIHVVFETAVPMARGLGSSATCIVGGLLAADALSGGALGRDAVLDLAARMEGHPDNVTPALLGGFAVAVLEAGHVHAVRVPVGPKMRFCALVPDFELETKVARAALPATLPFRDAVFNAGRAALMTAAFLSGDVSVLGAASQDRLHQPYRAPLIPGFDAIIAKSRELGALASFLSGAGPTIMTVVRPEDEEFVPAMSAWLAGQNAQAGHAVPVGQVPATWELFDLAADDRGATAGLVANDIKFYTKRSCV